MQFLCIFTFWGWQTPAYCHLAPHEPAQIEASIRPSHAEEPAVPVHQTKPAIEHAMSRTPLVNPAPRPGPRVTIADDVVLEVLDGGRSALQTCVRRAEDRDPGSVPRRVDFQLEVDATGTVTSARTELEDVRLRVCLTSVARGLRFPSPGRDATASLVFLTR
jgi:hypothetical protein